MGLALTTSVFSVTSSDRRYNVTPDSISLNWTNSYRSNITIATNASNSYTFILGVVNGTTGISSYYSQHSAFNYDPYTYFSSGCFNSNSAERDNPLTVRNQTGVYINTTAALSNGTSETLTLIHYVTCPPGRYYGNLTITNATNSTGAVNVTVTIDVPISTDNELNASTGIGMFKGSLPAHASAYHSYYFSTTNISNARGVVVNLSWSSSGKDIDLFLFDSSGNLRAKSIKTNSNSEQLNYNYLPSGEMWEIRLFGNLSPAESYTGYIYFTTLNATNSSSNATLELVNLGSMNVDGSRLVNITLKNDGNINFTNITETREIYHLDRFSDNKSSNFTVLIPASATKIRASVNWTGGANYTLTLYNPSGLQAGNSTDKHLNANVTGAMQEEFVETTNSSEGLWRVGVINNTNTTTAYTVSVKFWVAAADWINSTYTTSSLNMSGLENYTKDFSANFTVPNSSISGLYKGSLKYRSSSGSIVEVPFRLNVSTAVLVVNNTMNSQTVTIKDNIGFNRSGSDIRILLPINNTGSQAIIFGQTANSTNLSKGSYYINFSYSYPAALNASQSGTLEINLTYNTNMTANSQGIYTGWIYLNATEAHPYQGFNLTVRLNLTDDLIVNITQIKTADGDNEKENASAAENVTLWVSVKYINGTNIGGDLNITNFTVWLVEGNVSESVYRVPSSGYLTNYRNPTWNDSNYYYLNVTVPANMVGGRYYVKINTTVKRNEASLLGIGNGYPLIVNNTGLYMSSVSSTSFGTVNEGSSYYYNATVINYGPVSSTGATLTFNKGTCPITIDTSSYGGTCSSVSGGGSNGVFTFTVGGNGSQTCWFRWKITGNNVSADTACSGMSITVNKKSFNNITGISMTVHNLDTGSSSSSTSSSTSTMTCSSNSDCDSNYYCSADSVCTKLSCASDEKIVNHACVKINIKVNITSYQPLINITLGNSSKTAVKAKNNGEQTETVKLNVTISGDINVSVSPISCSLSPAESCQFDVTFNVSEAAKLGNHSGTFKAYVSDKPTYFDTESFRVFVLSTKEREMEINLTFRNYTKTLGELERQLNDIAASGIFPEANLSNARLKINQSRGLVSDIENAISSRNWPGAESLLSDLNSTLTNLKSRITELLAEKERLGALAIGGIWYIVIGVVAALVAIGFVVYLLLPPKGYDVKRGYTHEKATMGKRTESVLRQMKEKLMKIIKKKGEEGQEKYKYNK
jgi:hypothetical protein